MTHSFCGRSDLGASARSALDSALLLLVLNRPAFVALNFLSSTMNIIPGNLPFGLENV